MVILTNAQDGGTGILQRETAKVVGVIAFLAVLAGVGTLVGSAVPLHESGVFLVPHDVSGIVAFTWSALSGGSIQGSFRVEGSSLLLLAVLTGAQYLRFVSWNSLSPNLYQVEASSGQLAVTFAGHDSFYLVLLHPGQTNTSAELLVDLDLTVSRVDPYYFASGVILEIFAAPAVLVCASRLKGPAPGEPPRWR